MVSNLRDISPLKEQIELELMILLSRELYNWGPWKNTD